MMKAKLKMDIRHILITMNATLNILKIFDINIRLFIHDFKCKVQKELVGKRQLLMILAM